MQQYYIGIFGIQQKTLEFRDCIHQNGLDNVGIFFLSIYIVFHVINHIFLVSMHIMLCI
uniref:Uncharacterized protein n=1 Tax=Rhizophora mucronata TaxID=61149 RepID=A0A2P2QYH1_RHIMU